MPRHMYGMTRLIRLPAPRAVPCPRSSSPPARPSDVPLEGRRLQLGASTVALTLALLTCDAVAEPLGARLGGADAETVLNSVLGAYGLPGLKLGPERFVVYDDFDNAFVFEYPRCDGASRPLGAGPVWIRHIAPVPSTRDAPAFRCRGWVGRPNRERPGVVFSNFQTADQLSVEVFPSAKGDLVAQAVQALVRAGWRAADSNSRAGGACTALPSPAHRASLAGRPAGAGERRLEALGPEHPQRQVRGAGGGRIPVHLHRLHERDDDAVGVRRA